MARKQRTWSVTLSVVGLRFRFKKETRALMPDWCPFPVTLEREPDNSHDPSAVKVMIAGSQKLKALKGVQLGYLSNRVDDDSGERVGVATLLAPKLDAGTVVPVKLWVTSIDPDDGTAELSARFRDVTKPVAKRKTRR